MAKAWTENEREKRRREKQDSLVRETAGEVLVSAGVGYVLTPMRCGVPRCEGLAVRIDIFAPFITDLNRCRRHSEEPQ